MDIIAHSLWTAAVAKAANKKKSKPLNVWLAAFWGIFPDLFAFAIPFTFMLLAVFHGQAHLTDFGPHLVAKDIPKTITHWIDVAEGLYNISHSLIVFLLFFAFGSGLLKRPFYEMLGWLLHILIDIPTHKIDLFPTPVFWPLSNWHFTHGVSWGTWHFQLINYSLMAVVFLGLWFWRKKAPPQPSPK